MGYQESIIKSKSEKVSIDQILELLTPLYGDNLVATVEKRERNGEVFLHIFGERFVQKDITQLFDMERIAYTEDELEIIANTEILPIETPEELEEYMDLEEELYS